LGQFNEREVKLEMTPLGANKILVRFENIADSFDNEWISLNLDLNQFADELFQSVNGYLPDYVNI